MVDSDDDTQTIEFNSNMFIPPTGSAGPTLGIDSLMNREKISKDAISIHSSGSGSTEETEEECSAEEDESGGGYNINHNQSYEDSRDQMKTRLAAEKARQEVLLAEKRDILYKMDRLENRGFNVPRKFTMGSDIEEMRTEYQRILREKEIEASIRLQQQMLVAFVTGVEILNTRFDPFDIQLDGFSESVNDSINDYDDIFEELHDKYKGAGKRMAPELRLMMGISGAAFKHHLMKSIFKKSNTPNVEEVLRSDPE